MGIGLENRGCLGCLNPSIELNDLLSVQGATNRDEAVSLWDSMTDWFCGTKKAEAKRLLFDVCSTETPSRDRIRSFYALRDLTGEEYKSRFYITPDRYVQRIYTIDPDENDYGVIEFGVDFYYDYSNAPDEVELVFE